MVEGRAGDELRRVVKISPGPIPRSRRRFHDAASDALSDDGVVTGVDAERIQREIEGGEKEKDGRGEFAEINDDVSSEVRRCKELFLRWGERHDVWIDGTSEK